MQSQRPQGDSALSADERMAIRTPEHVELRFVLAGAGNRFLALAMDLIIQWLILIAVFAALGILWRLGKLSLGRLQGVAPQNAGSWFVAGVVLLVFLVQWGYFTFFETIWSGQTPGKRRQRIRVIRENGRPIGFAEAAIRNLLRIVFDSHPYPLHAIGFLTGILNPRFKRLGDFAAGTVVIVERRQRVPKKGARLRAPKQTMLPDALHRIRELTREEVATLQAYLRRREDLDAAVRSAMAKKIALSLMQRLEIAQPVDMEYDAFLERLEEQVRASQALHSG